jgi:hypothetical protein
MLQFIRGDDAHSFLGTENGALRGSDFRAEIDLRGVAVGVETVIVVGAGVIDTRAVSGGMVFPLVLAE